VTDDIAAIVKEELAKALTKDPKSAFDAEIATLKASPRKSPSALRAIQQKYRDEGLSEADLDVNPSSKVRLISEWSPPE